MKKLLIAWFTLAGLITACSRGFLPITGAVNLGPSNNKVLAATPGALLPVVAQNPPTQTPEGLPPLECNNPASLTPAYPGGGIPNQDSPERTSFLSPEITGTQLTLSGYVLGVDCNPVPHVWLEFWQSNGRGSYTGTGSVLRGHQFTDSMGRYHLTTIVPGAYANRPRHIHVRVQAPKGPILTTQLFFPGPPDKQFGLIFNPDLLMTVEPTSQGVWATFNFIIDNGS